MQGHCKDYLWQCRSWRGRSTHATWKGSVKTLQGLPLTMLILGGQLTHNSERIHKDIAGITSDNVDPGWGQSTHNLERIHKDIARITSDNVDPAGVNQHTTWKGSAWRHCKDYLWQCWSWGGGGSIVTQLGKDLHEDIARITSDNVDPGGSIDTQLGKDPQRTLEGLPKTMLTLEGSINMQLGKDPWGHCKDYLWQCWSWGFNRHTTWKGSAKSLQELPLTMLILEGGSIDTQLGKDLWRHCKDYLWQCWSWGVDWHTTWKGSMRTMQGLPLTMLIQGVDWHTTWKGSAKGHCKDYFWQCWFLGGQLTHNLERVHEDIARITSDNVDPWGSINTQLGKDPQRHCKDYLWQCWSCRGQSTHNLERICMKTLQGLPLTMLIPGESIDTQLGKDLWRHCKDYLWQCWSWGVNWHTTWKGSTKTLQGLPLTMLILGGSINTQFGKDPQRHCKDYLWQCWSWGVDWHTTWKGTMRTLQGLPLTMLIQGVDWHTTWKGSAWRHCKDYLWQYWSWGGQSTHNLERICMKTLQGLPLIMLILGGQSAHNLERICEDIARITSDNVDPGGSINTQLGKDLQRHCKDYLWQCWSWWLGQHTTWKGSMRTSQGLPLTMLILGGWLTHILQRIHEDITRITSDNVDPGGWLTHNLERIHKDIARITSNNVDPGGWLTHNLERICEDIVKITSDNVDLGMGGQFTHN